MEKEDTILFWHRENSWYLKTALQQAKKFNSKVVLLGDEKNLDVWSDSYNMDELPSDKYEAFKDVYQNYSLNNKIFELRCFERYFYVYEYCKKIQLNRIILCDSDLLIYQNLTQYFSGQTRAFSHTVSNPDGMAVSPHCSLWTLEDLESFVSFLIAYYQLHSKKLEEIFNQI